MFVVIVSFEFMVRTVLKAGFYFVNIVFDWLVVHFLDMHQVIMFWNGIIACGLGYRSHISCQLKFCCFDNFGCYDNAALIPFFNPEVRSFNYDGIGDLVIGFY